MLIWLAPENHYSKKMSLKDIKGFMVDKQNRYPRPSPHLKSLLETQSLGWGHKMDTNAQAQQVDISGTEHKFRLFKFLNRFLLSEEKIHCSWEYFVVSSLFLIIICIAVVGGIRYVSKEDSECWLYTVNPLLSPPGAFLFQTHLGEA